MNKCKNCGAMLIDEAESCDYCGVSTGYKKQNTSESQTTSFGKSGAVSGSGKVKTSTIYGIISLVFCTSFIGLILGVLGIKESKKDGGQIGKVLSVISIIIFIAIAIFVVIFIIITIVGNGSAMDSFFGQNISATEKACKQIVEYIDQNLGDAETEFKQFIK